MAQRGIRSRGSPRIVGPHGERNSVLREGVARWAAVRLRVQEALALLRTLLEPGPLQLALGSCGPQQRFLLSCTSQLKNKGVTL